MYGEFKKALKIFLYFQIESQEYFENIRILSENEVDFI